MNPRSAVAWRLAWRSTRADGWRAILIVVLVTLATAASVASGVLARSAAPEPGAERAARFGSAQLLVDAQGWGPAYDDLPSALQAEVDERYGGPLPRVSDDEVMEALRDLVPLDAEVVRTRGRWAEVGGIGVELLAAPVDAPVLAGMLRGDVGRAPAADEVLVAGAVLRATGTEVGGTLEVPGVGPRRIAGQVESPAGWRSAPVVVAPETELPGATGSTAWYVSGLDEAAVRELQADLERRFQPGLHPDGPVERGISVELASWYDGWREPRGWPVQLAALVGAALLVQVGAVAAATFATGTRRRVREFGVLAAGAGADPRHVRQVVRREAVVLGGLGAAGGLVLGLLAAVALLPVVGRFNDRVLPFQLSGWDLVLPATMAVLAVSIAAWLPARTVSRVPLVAALAGRVPLRPVPAWVTPASLLVAGLGLVTTATALWATHAGPAEYMVMAGPNLPYRGLALVVGIGLLLGGAAGLAGPLLQALARRADRLPLQPRLAVRDSGRQRMRSAATVAATMVVLVVPALVATAVATEDGSLAREHLPTRDDVVVVVGPSYGDHVLSAPADDAEVLRDALPPVHRELEVATLVPGEERSDARVELEVATERADGTLDAYSIGPVAVASSELLALVGVDGPLSDDAIVVVQDTYGEGHLVVSRNGELLQRSELAQLVRPEVVLPGGLQGLVAPALAAELGLEPGPTVRVLQLDTPLTAAQLESAAAISNSAMLGHVALPFPGTGSPDGTLAVWLTIAGALMLVLLLAVGTAALAATESDRDLAAMAAVGADPRTRPRFRAVQAWLHATLAAVLAIPIGVALAEVLRRDGMTAGSLVVPWVELAALLLLVPLLVTLPVRWLSRPSPLLVTARRPT